VICGWKTPWILLIRLQLLLKLYKCKTREKQFSFSGRYGKWFFYKRRILQGQNVGLNVEQLKADFEGNAQVLFDEDLKLGRELGVRGFPTMIFLNDSDNDNEKRIYLENY